MYGYVIEKKSFFQQKYPNGFIQQISTKTEKDTLRKTEIISTVCVCVVPSLCVRMSHCSDLRWPYGYCARHFSSHLLCIKDLTLLSTHLGGLSTHTHLFMHTNRLTLQTAQSNFSIITLYRPEFPTFFFFFALDSNAKPEMSSLIDSLLEILQHYHKK